MGLFSDMLKEGETLFRNEIALDYEYLPKLLPYREQEQHFLATCMKPLLMGRNGRNVLITGSPGIGKTAASKFVLRDLEEESDEVITLYVNCWQRNTSFKIFTYLCEELGFKFIQNKKTEELFKLIRERVNKTSVVFIFDEIDKVEDYDFLYSILEEVFKKTVVCITNFKEWIVNLDMRIKSRLMPQVVEYKPYSVEETRGILKQRSELAFVPDIWNKEAFETIVAKAAEIGDIRTGLYMLREAGLNAEQKSSTKIEMPHVEDVISKLAEFSRKDTKELNDEERFVLSIAKKNSGKKIGDHFTAYQQEGGRLTYKTFQRKIAKLSSNGFILTKKLVGGSEGNTTIVEYSIAKKTAQTKLPEDLSTDELFTDAKKVETPQTPGNKTLNEF